MSRPNRPLRIAAATALTAAITLIVAACDTTTGTNAAVGASPSPTAAVGGPAPTGTFTTVGGKPVDVASFRGKPTVLWFVAAGCSSCTASIPAVADHLSQLHAEGVQVAVIDLYGDLGSGPAGATALAKLGTGLVGNRFAEPGWTWGTSSKALSYSYDHTGEPDIYYVIDRNGTITYRNSVPVSTMDQLLAHTHAVA